MEEEVEVEEVPVFEELLVASPHIPLVVDAERRLPTATPHSLDGAGQSRRP